MIYFAPLQGFTDFVYRRTYAAVFGEIDAFFVPYISLKNNSVLPKYIKEVRPENNRQQRVIPQLMAKNGGELLKLAMLLKQYGYNEVNLNLGCPYPMVTNQGKGSGLLPYPEKVRGLLTEFFEKQDLQLSVKLRAGLISEKEIELIIPVLNEFPLKEVIFHPRIAKQLYSGEIIENAFKFATRHLTHKLVYNGDVFTRMDYENRKQMFPEIQSWMLGRGVLMNPFLPAEMNGQVYSENEKREKLRLFHTSILENYLEIMDNEGNVLNKMKQFWFYFSCNFANPKKAFKAIKKSKDLMKLKTESQGLFAQL